MKDFWNGISQMKLNGGMSGKVTAMVLGVSFLITSMAIVTRNDWIIGGAIAGILMFAFISCNRLINFANKNPEAAILEGGEFVRHQELLLASKDGGTIRASAMPYVEATPATLTPAEQETLALPDQAPAALPGPETGQGGNNNG